MRKTLIAYFSASGVTAAAAQTLAKESGAALYEIRPAEKYTRADLDWTNKRSRSSLEMQNPASRPALADHDAPVKARERMLLGFPIWWGVAPTLVNSFLEAYDLSGKEIVLFATSGGSGFGHTAAALESSCPGAKLREGKLFVGRPSPAALREWAQALKDMD